VHQLGARAELLRGLEGALVRNDELRIDRHVVEDGAAADGGTLSHHVPVLVKPNPGRIPPDEGQDQAAVVIQGGDADPA
jgi:hypothetical protein